MLQYILDELPVFDSIANQMQGIFSDLDHIFFILPVQIWDLTGPQWLSNKAVV